MALITYKNVGIKALAAAVPSHVIDNYKYDLDIFPEDEVRKVVDKVGVYERRFADENTCSSDLCYEAAKKLFEDNDIDSSEIDLLVFLSQTPDYRMPAAKNVLQLLWEKAKDFLQRAFSVILVATIIIWFLQSFDASLNFVTDSEESILAGIAGVLAPVFKPIGLGDWRIVTALISGFMAKESVVATLELLFGTDIASVLPTISAAALLVFCLLYTPCVAAVAAVRRELGTRTAAVMVIWQCVVAWIAAFLIRAILIALGL